MGDAQWQCRATAQDVKNNNKTGNKVGQIAGRRQQQQQQSAKQSATITATYHIVPPRLLSAVQSPARVAERELDFMRLSGSGFRPPPPKVKIPTGFSHRLLVRLVEASRRRRPRPPPPPAASVESGIGAGEGGRKEGKRVPPAAVLYHVCTSYRGHFHGPVFVGVGGGTT